MSDLVQFCLYKGFSIRVERVQNGYQWIIEAGGTEWESVNDVCFTHAEDAFKAARLKIDRGIQVKQERKAK